MKSKIILCFSLVLLGCYLSSGQTNISPVLYVHFGEESSRLLSARIHLEETIFVGGSDYLELKGHIERHGTNLVADLMGSTGQQSQFYRGNVTLENPCFAQGGAASGGAGGTYWFAVSTNSDSRAIVERVNAMMGFTNTPVKHQTAILVSPPAVTNFSEQTDPATGLPVASQLQKQQ